MKSENNLGTTNPGDSKYIIIYFRLLTQKYIKMELTLHYTDEVNVCSKKITIQGNGYHPLKSEPLKKFLHLVICQMILFVIVIMVK